MYSKNNMYKDAGTLAEALKNTVMHRAPWKMNYTSLTSIPVMAIFLKYCNDNQKKLQIDIPEILQFVVLNKVLPDYLPEEQLQAFFDRMQNNAGIGSDSWNIFSHVLQDTRKEEFAVCLKEMLFVVDDWDLDEEENGPVAMCAAIQFLSIMGRVSYLERNSLPFEVVTLIKNITPLRDSMKCYSNSAGTAAQLPYITATTDYSLYGFVDQYGVADAEAIALMMSPYANRIKMFEGLFDWLPEDLKGEERTFDLVVMSPRGKRFYDSQVVVKAVEDGNESLVAWWPEEPGCKEWMFARNLVNLLSEQGTGYIIYPLNSLAKIGSQAEIRKKLLEERLLKAVIELPSGVMPPTGAKYAILVLGKNNSEPGVFMMNLDSEQGKELVSIKRGEVTKFDVDEIARIFNERDAVKAVSGYVSFDEIIKTNVCLSPSAYISDSRYKKIMVDLDAEYEIQNNNVAAFMKDTTAWDADIAEYMAYRLRNSGGREVDRDGGTTYIEAE